MKRTRFVLLILTLLLFACQSQLQPVSVSFMISGDPAERIAYETLVNAFHAQHPEIQIEVTHIPSDRDYRTRLVTDFAAGTPPDVTLMNYRRYASFAANGLLEPLTPFIEDSELVKLEAFFPVTIEAFTWQGQLMCIPQNISSLVVYYNQDLFDAAGVAYPTDNWSWDDFVETAKALTVDVDGNGRINQYGLGIDASLFRLAPFVWQNSDVIVDSDAFPSRMTLTRPLAQEAFQWFVDLRQVHGVVPDRVEEESLDSESRFVAGTTAMFLNSRRGTPAYREIETFTWDIAPLPHGDQSAGILHSDGYCLSSVTQNKDAAWRFIEFANSEEGQTIIASSGRTVPSRISVAQSDAFMTPNLSPSRSYVFVDQTDLLRRVPVMSTWQEIESVATEEIERAFYGDITVAEAAALITQRTSEYFFLAQFAGSSGN